MSWRIAESLEILRRQLNAAFPNRSKVSDGGIGDAAHASRGSDHNPWVRAGNMGIVTARDFTHDPKGGVDCNWLAKKLVESRDPRIKYIIWNKQICSSKQQPWKWRPYNGINAHRHHLHLSVDADPKLYDSTAPWDLDIAQAHNPIADLTDEEIDTALDEKLKVSTAEGQSANLPQTEDANASFANSQPSNPSIAEVQTTVNSDGQTEIEKTQQVAQGFTAEKFTAYIPQIDTAKRYLKTLSGMTGLGAVAAFFAGLPPWLIIALFVLLAIIIIGGIVIIVKYHEKIFAYITAMNTLRATEGTHNPIVTSEKPE